MSRKEIKKELREIIDRLLTSLDRRQRDEIDRKKLDKLVDKAFAPVVYLKVLKDIRKMRRKTYRVRERYMADKIVEWYQENPEEIFYITMGLSHFRRVISLLENICRDRGLDFKKVASSRFLSGGRISVREFERIFGRLSSNET